MDAAAAASFHKKVVQHPEVFFTPSEAIAQEIKAFTKHVFDHCTQFVSRSAQTPLDQLYIDGFDADQIWEQLKLQNGPLLEELSKRIRGFAKKSEGIRLFPEENAEEEEVDESEEEQEEELDVDSDDDNDEEEEEEEEEEEGDKKRKAAKKSKAKKARDVAEDGFFDWDEMDKMAEEEEMDEEDEEEEEEEVLEGGEEDMEDDQDMDDSEDDDMEDEDLDDDEAANMTFDDFFEGPKNAKRKSRQAAEEEEEEEEEAEEEEEEDDDAYASFNRSAPAGDDEEDGDNDDDDDAAERGIMSSHQRQRQRLKQEIAQLEKEALAEKPWLLKGEVRSAARPENSLLEAVLDYDRPVKAAPVITVEVSVALEDMIKKRIVEDAFDDVVRKFAPNEQDEKNKLVDVSMEKAKEGLGEIYEKEYMKTAMGFEADDGSKQDQDEIELLFKNLCWKLDALSNYQFTPKPMVKELQVKPSVPAIAMEEVVPISVSDANLQTPEEIFAKKRKRGEAVLQSKEEMTQDERKAQRNAKKRVRRKANQQKEADERLVAKLHPGLGNKYAKKKMLESIATAKNVTTGKEIEGSTKQFSNSKEFFTRLQEEVQSDIKKKAAATK